MIRLRGLPGRHARSLASLAVRNCAANHARSQSSCRNSSTQSGNPATKVSDAATHPRAEKKQEPSSTTLEASLKSNEAVAQPATKTSWTDIFKGEATVEARNTLSPSPTSDGSEQDTAAPDVLREASTEQDGEESDLAEDAHSTPEAAPQPSAEIAAPDSKSGKRNAKEPVSSKKRRQLKAALKSKKKFKAKPSKKPKSKPSGKKLEPTLSKKSEATSSTKKPEPTPVKKKPAKKSGSSVIVKRIKPRDLQLVAVDDDNRGEVPSLSYNLDRVLFNPGVYQIQDPRSGVFNFDPYLASIMPIEEFDFDTLKDYTTSSKDVKLRQMCAEQKRKYCGSTSSLTSILSHFHFLLSAWRPISIKTLSYSLRPESYNFTQITRGPAAAYARLVDGVYCIDADKQFDISSVLSLLGKAMEKLLTVPKEEFEKHRKINSHQIPDEKKKVDETFHYTTLGDFLMRSQLDAHDPRLPGTGVFDLKTRAVVTVRMDVHGYEKGAGYEIRGRFGQWESFEREYYDMIRSAFLKYSLQVRMGRMDGIFVAFHNTQRIFGFQYISLEEMDGALHGTSDPRIGDEEFKCSVALLNDLLDRATARFPGRTLRFHVETRPTKVPLTYFFAEPVTDEEMERNQEAASKPFAEKLERQLRQGLKASKAADGRSDAIASSEQQQFEETDGRMDDAASDDPESEAAWAELMRRVEKTVEDESLGIESLKGALKGALAQSGLLKGLAGPESDQCVDEMVAVLTAHISEGRVSQDMPAEDDSAGPDQSDPVSAHDETQPDAVSLTDLIIRVTKTVDEEKHSLKEFQRVLVDVANQSRKPESAESSQTGGAGGEGIDAAATSETVSEADTETRELLGMYVTIRNQVKGAFVDRPGPPKSDFEWSVEYAVDELPDERAQKIYQEIKARRRRFLENDPDKKHAEWYNLFGGNMPTSSRRGEDYRRERNASEAGNPIYVAWDKEPLDSGDRLSTDSGSSG